MDAITRPALRYHGGKSRLAPWIIKHLPPHRYYVEPFGGAASVLLAKPAAHLEVYNDLDDDISNFFRVVRDSAMRERLIEACMLTPYARAEFRRAYEHTDEPVERARRTAVRAAMGFGSAGATKGRTGFRIDSTRPRQTVVTDWALYPPVLAAIGQRLLGVMIEQRDAMQVMQSFDGPETLHYVDPPYLPETRVSQNGKLSYYRHELTAAQHAELLQGLQGLQGMVVLSGYPSTLYSQQLHGWTMYTTKARIAANRGTGIRTEALWLNPAASAALAGAAGGLFREAACHS